LHHGRAVIRKAIYDPGIPADKRNATSGGRRFKSSHPDQNWQKYEAG
jgi:hypothetical protein